MHRKGQFKIFAFIFITIFFAVIGVNCKPRSQVFLKDNARVIPIEERQKLNLYIQDHFNRTEKQVIAYTIDKIGNESFEEYSSGLIKKTFFGPAGYKNSLVIIL